MATTVKNPRATKKFKKLLALLEEESMAVTAWNASHPESLIPVADSDEITDLIAAGFTREQAVAALAAATKTDTSAAPEPERLTSAKQGEVLAAKGGFVPVRGRVYSHPALIEAQARVLKTGSPELVQNPGEHHTKAVLVYRTDDGKSVALQNHGVQN